jgi:hypothetical protein
MCQFVGFSGGNLIYFINLADPTFMGHNFMHYPCQLSALELDPDGTNSLFISS